MAVPGGRTGRGGARNRGSLEARELGTTGLRGCVRLVAALAPTVDLIRIMPAKGRGTKCQDRTASAF